MIQQAGGEDDAALLPSVPLEPSAAGAEPAGLQPGEFVAASGFAERDRKLVAHQFAATAGENRRTAGETCSLLLATSDGRTPESTAIRSDAGPDRIAADSDGITVRRWSSRHRNRSKAVGKRRSVPKVQCNMA